MLVKHFPRVLDVKFTAGMETELDDVEEGKQNKEALLKAFWTPFADTVKTAETEMERYARDTGEACPDCGSALVEKMSRYGKMFTGCSNHPTCKYIKPSENAGEAAEPIISEILCPNCNRNLVQKMGRFGPFLACPGYPDCKYIHKEQPQSSGVKCPTCGEGELVQKKSRMGVFYSCNLYPKCKTALPSLPLERKCPKCAGVLVESAYKGRVTGVKCLTADCDYKETAAEAKEAVETTVETAT
jgi:DNA topoisomerase I